MGKWEEKADTTVASPIAQPWMSRLWSGIFLAFFLVFCVAVVFVLYEQGALAVLAIALLVAGAIGALCKPVTGYPSAKRVSRNCLHSFWGPALLILIVAAGVCLPTFSIYFLADDFGHLHLFQQASFGDFLRLFSTDLSQNIWGRSYQELRPLYGLSFILGYRISGLYPEGYHLLNFAQHIACSWLVFRIAREVTGCECWKAAFAGLLFAVFPLHAENVSWISGGFSTISPTMFYLAAFLGFVLFRHTYSLKYYALAVGAFLAGLLSKEIVVTFPAMMLSYDLFRKLTGEELQPPHRKSEHPSKVAVCLLPYLPFVVLLIAYFGVRWMIFQSALKEDEWGASIPHALSSWPAFLYRLGRLWMRFQDLHLTTLRILLYGYSPWGFGIAFGLLLGWAFFLWRNRTRSVRLMALALYFGLVWYVISGAPHVVTGPDVRYLYLPLAGLCITLAVLLIPPAAMSRKETRCLAWLGAAFLVTLSGFRLWTLNQPWVEAGAISVKLLAQFPSLVSRLPPGSVVLTSLPADIEPAFWEQQPSGWNWRRQLDHAHIWIWSLPFVLQEPFQKQDFSSRVRILEEPLLSYRTTEQWWEKARGVLDTAVSGDPQEEVELYLMRWDERSQTVQTMERAVSRGFLRDFVEEILQHPLESSQPTDYATRVQLVRGLRDLISKGSSPSTPERSGAR